MPRRSDIWRSAIIGVPADELLQHGFDGHPVVWLPEAPAFTFDADPFGLWRDGRLHVFVETYDYRVRVGGIDVLCYDAGLQLQWRKPCLREPWHLSYPFVVEDGANVWMLPEAHRAGGLTLYRAEEYPVAWRAAARIELDCVPVDATPVHYQGRWWMFYSPATSKQDKIGKLHVAYADQLSGPWHAHPRNPVRVDPSSSRPGGTPLVMNGRLVLPTQDCRNTYGGAIRLLHVERLTTTDFAAEAGALLESPDGFAPYTEGLHTLAACGPVTLVDAKYIDRSPRGLMIDIGWRLSRFARRLRGS